MGRFTSPGRAISTIVDVLYKDNSDLVDLFPLVFLSFHLFRYITMTRYPIDGLCEWFSYVSASPAHMCVNSAVRCSVVSAIVTYSIYLCTVIAQVHTRCIQRVVMRNIVYNTSKYKYSHVGQALPAPTWIYKSQPSR